MTLLGEQAIRQKLESFPDWSNAGHSIKRTLTFDTFRQGIDFVCIFADLIETWDHHPDLEIRDNEVTVYCASRTEKGITQNDFATARKIDDVIASTLLFEESE